MLFRILPLGIVLFWLGSVGWLCAVVWAPPGSRMARVDPLDSINKAGDHMIARRLLAAGVDPTDDDIAQGMGRLKELVARP